VRETNGSSAAVPVMVSRSPGGVVPGPAEAAGAVEEQAASAAVRNTTNVPATAE
jgi:hypothetical protein